MKDDLNPINISFISKDFETFIKIFKDKIRTDLLEELEPFKMVNSQTFCSMARQGNEWIVGKAVPLFWKYSIFQDEGGFFITPSYIFSSKEPYTSCQMEQQILHCKIKLGLISSGWVFDKLPLFLILVDGSGFSDEEMHELCLFISSLSNPSSGIGRCNLLSLKVINQCLHA